MNQAYYRKWRPKNWDEIIGQDHVTRTLHNSISNDKFAHAYLFSGPRGTGKTSTARIVAKAANCLHEDFKQRPCNDCENCVAINENRFLDLIEIDAASNTSVEDVRDLRERINFSPTKGRKKVYIIDEVHMLSNAAFNALLKTLEEPPDHAIFVLATTEVHKIPPTVLSRCQRHEFRRIPLNTIQAHLKHIAEEEKIQVETAALTAIARQATGSLRDAESMLDQIASSGEAVTFEYTQQVLGTAAHQSIFEMVNALTKSDLGSAITILNNALDSGSDARQYARQIVDVLRAILMAKTGNLDRVEASREELEKFEELAKQLSQRKLLSAIRAFDKAAQHTHASWQPGLQLELAAARAIHSNQEMNIREVDNSKTNLDKVNEQKNKTTKTKASNEKKVEETQKKKKMVTDIPGNPKKETREEKETNITPNAKDSSSLGGIQGINSHWKEIRDAAKSVSAETAALLNSCRSVTMRRGRLVLGFASPVLCSKMETGRNIEIAKSAVHKVTGQMLEIDCMVANQERTTTPEDLGIETDGMVGEALSLGGKITKKEKVKSKEEDK